MEQIHFGRRGRLLPRLALITGTVLSLSACDTESILDVQDPDIVTPESLTAAGEGGRAALYAGAIGDFAVAWDGGGGGGSFLDGIVTTSAYLSDEAYLSGTFPTRTEFDQRSIDIRNGTLNGVFRRLQFARRATQDAAAVLRDANAADNRVGELLALAGYTYIGFGENFCSGVPFSTAPAQGELEFGSPTPTNEIFNLAIQRFDAAIAAAGTNARARNLALIGKARAQLNLGQFTQAAQTAAQVPTNSLYTIGHSVASGRQENGLFAANTLTRRLSIANDEGGSGAPFLRSMTTDGEGLSFLAERDPRVPFDSINGAFDATVPVTYTLSAYGPFGIELARNAPSPLASGIEARLIEAEAALRAGNPARMLLILNQLRASSRLGLSPLTLPITQAGQVDLLFKERAFWLYGTGHRVGDLRRLIRQYGRSPNQVFPTGAYFKGGTYGDDVNLPIPFDEQNNPNFEQCIDRNA